MKKLLMTAVGVAMAVTSFAIYADMPNTPAAPANPSGPAPQAAPLPLVNWASRGEEIKIENGNGANLVIQITVHGTESSPGILIKNCGQTTAIKAGSSAICHTVDSRNPVTFTSDSKTESATGTYQITQQQ